MSEPKIHSGILDALRQAEKFIAESREYLAFMRSRGQIAQQELKEAEDVLLTVRDAIREAQ